MAGLVLQPSAGTSILGDGALGPDELSSGTGPIMFGICVIAFILGFLLWAWRE
jgi:hypothetical protein